MPFINLNGSDWTIKGYVQHKWKLPNVMETGDTTLPEIGPYPATVPGSVHTDLFAVGILPDVRYGLNFMSCEWLEHRDWVYTKHFTVDDTFEKYILVLEGLDYSGIVRLNGEKILDFKGTHLSWRVDITDKLTVGQDNELLVAFDIPPATTAQIGYTSLEQSLKTRFNYCWDWCPRLVNTGIWRDVYVKAYNHAQITDFFPNTDGDGHIHCQLTVDAHTKGEYSAVYTVKRNGLTVASGTQPLSLKCCAGQCFSFALTVENPALWFPNGYGEQPLYEVTVSLQKDGEVCESCLKKVGFKKLTYVHAEGAPTDSMPYTPVFDGKKVFIKGINWVPISAFYGSVTRTQYESTLRSFQQMNLNFIRVWGGGVLESEDFYELCDTYGIMVLQEFPQSSSGLDNVTCEEYDFVDRLCEVAKHNILSRRSHVSLHYWCGGNELYFHNMIPVDDKHSYNLHRLHELCTQYDADSLFVPASPNGPNSTYDSHVPGGNYDVHGPWDYLGAAHYPYWNKNTAILNAEVGTSSPPRYRMLEKYRGGFSLNPPTVTNLYWQNRGNWWIRDKQLQGLFGAFDFETHMEEYAVLWRFMHAESVRFAVESIRRKFDRNAGIIIWMGNEPYPNNANTSLLEADGTAKPAYYALKNANAAQKLILSYDKVCVKPGEAFALTVWATANGAVPASAITATVYNAAGKEIAKASGNCAGGIYSVKAFDFTFVPPKEGVYLVRLSDGSEYLLCAGVHEQFAALRALPKAKLTTQLNGKTCVVSNVSSVTAFGVFICGEGAEDVGVNGDIGYFNLLPGESRTIRFETAPERVHVEGINAIEK